MPLPVLPAFRFVNMASGMDVASSGSSPDRPIAKAGRVLGHQKRSAARFLDWRLNEKTRNARVDW